MGDFQMNLKYLSAFFVVLAMGFLVNNNLFSKSSRLMTENTKTNGNSRQIASANMDEQSQSDILLKTLKHRKPAHVKFFTELTQFKYEFLMGKYKLETVESQTGTKVVGLRYISSNQVDDVPVQISEGSLIAQINKVNKSNLDYKNFDFQKDSEGRLLSLKVSF